MRPFFIVFLLFVVAVTAFPKRVAVLKKLNKPEIMKIDRGLLLIGDITDKVHLYNLKAFSYRQIGKKGNGPGEYPNMPEIHFAGENIFLYRMGKCMFFSREGKYIGEFKIPDMRTTSICPFGKNFLIIRAEYKNTRDMYSQLSIVTHSKEDGLKHKKLLYYQDEEKQTRTDGKRPIYVLPDYFDYAVYRDKVFVHDNSIGMVVEIYDLEGNEIRRISLPYEKKKVPDNYNDSYIEFIKKKNGWDLFKSNYYLVTPEYFPAFYRFAVDNGKMYFMTHNEKDDKRELVVADWEGNIIKRTYVPWVGKRPHTYFAIENDKFYYIKENEDTEEWELHVEDIK
jgi:hypothetical protein